MQHYLDFERPLAELESKIKELRRLSDNDTVNIVEEVSRLESKLDRLLVQTYTKLTPWQKTQVARHPERPHTSHYIEQLLENFVPLAGDRLYGEDHALVAGLGTLHGRSLLLMGHEKGSDTESRVRHNFGMARPEGYRKAVRLMNLANRFSLPVISLVDTSGAYPGIGAEERGQAEAIARSIETCLEIKVPFVSVVIGEGGSGGAIAIAVADRVLMLEHAVYSVISPEGCASILWRSGDQAETAAEAMKLTANDLIHLKVIDEVIKEPLGGAHRDPAATVADVGRAIGRALSELENAEPGTLLQARREKFMDMGRQGVS
ncbi:MAG: acetyl-CoA carboxylase carboxyltransferase subunit alpha [Rhodospirillales bacterium]|nr:acetyl-CoA carboxylase carboxyltransferase subunit alpha [Rhodospirillales bacterium]